MIIRKVRRKNLDLKTEFKFKDKNFLLIAFCFLCFSLLFSGCKNEQVDFSGWVVNTDGFPLTNANVTINNATIQTAKDGSFNGQFAPNKVYRIAIKHKSHADLFQVSRYPLEGQVWKLPSASIKTVDPTGTVTLIDDRPVIDGINRAGAIFTLPPNALVDENGNSPSGSIRGAIATLDLSTGEGPQDWSVRDDLGTEGFLVSYGAVFIEFTSNDGQTKYQIKNGMTGQLSLPVIPSMEAHVSSTPNAPFWYYDEGKAEWFKAGESTFDVNTGSYVGSVNHLSTINTDIAKYNNAACLAITLDPSISSGHQLRIRYHSGGTPFGQVPSFAMTAVLNGAWRLPANTNILLELLSPGGQVLSNLVVEDPAGTTLVNTVVNTGAALPSGANLWPPSPFTSCKPITLWLGAPQVEIRINEQAAAALPIDNPSDDYLTWSPTYAMARLASPGGSNVTVHLTNDSPAAGGNVRFAQHQATWPVNTTATSNTLQLILPASGAWVPFMIAGEFNSPSIDDKDAIIEAHQNTVSGTILGTKAMMVRVRKDANTLSTGEKGRYLFAWQKFKNKVGGMNYIQAQEIHRLANEAFDEAHRQPAFLTWHRAFLLQIERELQAFEPSVALHYWDWDAAAPNVFEVDFIGESGSGGSIEEPNFDLLNPLLGWHTDLPFSSGDLQRNTNNHKVLPSSSGGMMRPLNMMVQTGLGGFDFYGANTPIFSENSFSGTVERRSHDAAHGWPCGGGHLREPNMSACDPLFYLLHSQIDRQWAYWQKEHNRHGVLAAGTLTFPAPQHYDNSGAWNSSPSITPDAAFRQKGSYLEDGIWPWDGTTGGSGVSMRPPNNGIGVDTPDERPDSNPIIPNSAFPASLYPNLWPISTIVPLNRHFIDYSGRHNPINSLGFCYDDTPFL